MQPAGSTATAAACSTSGHPASSAHARTLQQRAAQDSSRIVHPLHGLRLRTVDLLDVSLQELLFLDHNINSGYIVDEVSVGSAAERLGIRSSEVIVSFDGLRDHTLPQLEDFLLSLGWRFLQRSTDSSPTVDVKLELYDLLGHRARTITLPIRFFDASEMVVVEEEEEEEEEEGEEEEDIS